MALRTGRRIVMAILCIIGLRLFTGIYAEAEWGDQFWFVKHRPTWQFSFPPVRPDGYEEIDIADMDPAKAAARLRYEEFTGKRLFEVSIPPLLNK